MSWILHKPANPHLPFVLAANKQRSNFHPFLASAPTNEVPILHRQEAPTHAHCQDDKRDPFCLLLRPSTVPYRMYCTVDAIITGSCRQAQSHRTILLFISTLSIAFALSDSHCQYRSSSCLRLLLYLLLLLLLLLVLVLLFAT